MSRIALVTAVWRRPAITAVFWRFIMQLRAWWADHELVHVVGGSEPEHALMASAAGAHYVELPNQPLGRKYNAIVAQARKYVPDAIAIMPSDDLFCDRVAAAYQPYLQSAHPYVGLEDLYFYDTGDRRLGYWLGYHQPHRIGEPAGCGRILPRYLLDRLDWQLWDHEKTRHMDHSSFQRLHAIGAPPCPLLNVQTLDGCAVDLKGPDSLWSFDHVAPIPQRDAAILGRFPADITAAIQAL